MIFFLKMLTNTRYIKLLKKEIVDLHHLWIPICQLFQNGFKEDEEIVLQEVMRKIMKFEQDE